MFRRYLAAAAIVAVAPLMPAHSAEQATLDGNRRSRYEYSADLSCCWTPSTISVGEGQPEPTPADCQNDGCDITQLILSVPRGRQSGRLQYDAETPATLQVWAALYDSKGKEVARDFTSTDGTVRLVVSRLRPGRYEVVLYPMVGQGTVEAVVSWKINPRHRT